MKRERCIGIGGLQMVMLVAMIVFAIVVMKAISIYETRASEQQSEEMVEFVEVKVQQLQTSQIQIQSSEQTETAVVVTKQERQRQLLSQYRPEARRLAQIMFCEAGADERYDMIYVGSTVLNRARTSYGTFADVNTIYEVLMQEGQYADPTVWKTEVEDVEPPESCYEVAEGLLNGTISILYEGVLFQVLEPLTLAELESWGVHEVYLKDAVHHYYVPNDFESSK